jgi:hypothetical protein
MKRVCPILLLALFMVAPVLAQRPVGQGSLFTVKNDSPYSLRLKMMPPSGDERDARYYDLNDQEQEFRMHAGWTASLEFGYGSGFAPVHLDVEDQMRVRVHVRHGIPHVTSKIEERRPPVGQGKRIQVENLTNERMTLIQFDPNRAGRYYPGYNEQELQAGDKLELTLHGVWAARLRFQDGSEMRINRPQDGKKYVLRRGWRGTLHLDVRDAEENRQKNPAFAKALRIEVDAIGSGQYKIRRVGFGIGRELRLATGDTIVQLSAISALDSRGQPRQGTILTGIKVKTQYGDQLEINLQNRQIWVR